MSLYRAAALFGVGLLAAGLTIGAGLAGLRRGTIAEARILSSGQGDRFEWVDIYVRGGGDAPIGAWQVALRGEGGTLAFVGVEGEPGKEPPVYDAAALVGGSRLVIGRISPPEAVAAKTEPRVRVARIHLRTSGRVELIGELEAVGDAEGRRIGGAVELVRGAAD